MQEHDLRHPPGRCQALHRHGEVRHRRGLPRNVHQREVRQPLREAHQEALLLQRQEVRPVDPHEVHGAAAVPPGRTFGDHPRHGLPRVAQADVAQGDAVQGLHPLRGPGDEGVGALVPGPGMERDGLAAGAGRDAVPPRLLGAGGQWQRGRKGGQAPPGQHHAVASKVASRTRRAARRASWAAAMRGASTSSWKRSQPMQRLA